jgi:hypothetical protein
VRPTGTETSGASVHRASSLGGWAFGASTSCLRSGMASLSLWSNELFVRMTPNLNYPGYRRHPMAVRRKSSIVVFQPQVCDQLVSHDVSQRVF